MQSSALVRGFFACVPEIGHCGMNACMHGLLYTMLRFIWATIIQQDRL